VCVCLSLCTGTSEGKLFSHVDNLLHSATDLALRCLQVEMEYDIPSPTSFCVRPSHPHGVCVCRHPNVVKDEEKDFGDFKESEFDSIYRKFTEKEEEMSKLREQVSANSLGKENIRHFYSLLLTYYACCWVWDSWEEFVGLSHK
jgi:hypothetical protein